MPGAEETLVYGEMAEDERDLDWQVTRRVMADRVLMRTLQDSQSAGEKHAVIALVRDGMLQEAYVSPRAAVEKQFPFDPIREAFEYYDLRIGVCLVIVRAGKVAVSVNGIR
jgi:hypothetical protein